MGPTPLAFEAPALASVGGKFLESNLKALFYVQNRKNEELVHAQL